MVRADDSEQLELLVPPRAEDGRPRTGRTPGRRWLVAAVAVSLVLAGGALLVARDGGAVAARTRPQGFHVVGGVVHVDQVRDHKVAVDLEPTTAPPYGVLLRARADDEDLSPSGRTELSVSSVVRGVAGPTTHCRGRPDLYWVLVDEPVDEATSEDALMGRCDESPHTYAREVLEGMFWLPPILPVDHVPSLRRHSARMFLTADDPAGFVGCLVRQMPDCSGREPPHAAPGDADFGVLVWERPVDPAGVELFGHRVATVYAGRGGVHRLVGVVAAADGADRLTHTLRPSTRDREVHVVGNGSDLALDVDGRRASHDLSFHGLPAAVLPAGTAHTLTLTGRGLYGPVELGFVVFEREP